MPPTSLKTFLLKLFAFWAAFLVLHYLYKWFPSPWLAVVSATSEAVAQHMKNALFAYTLVSLGEYFIHRPAQRLRFFDARLLVNLLAPWAMFLWYLAPVFYGQPMPTVVLEIIYANIILFLAGTLLLLIERGLSNIELSRASRAAALVFFILITLLLVGVTYREPWGGFFYHQE